MMASHAATPASRSLSCASSSRPRPVTHGQRLLCRSGPPQVSTSIPTQVAAGRPQQQPQPAQQLRKRHELLRDPAKIGSRGTASVMVNDVGGPVSLTNYMQLPVEQYYILDPSQIQLLSGNTFVLSVPRINLLGATLQPVITVEVTSEAEAVVLQATDCQLNATGIMGGLDEKFAMQFTTRLTWRSPKHEQQHYVAQEQLRKRELELLAAEQQQLKAQQAQQQQQQAPSSSASAGASSTAGSSIRAGWDRLRQVSWKGSSNGGSNGGSNFAQQQQPLSPVRGSITGSAVVDVWCEVIPPFNLMPKEVLVGTCNTVISGLVNSLLPWFTRQLAADYQKWAHDAAYRAARAARSPPKQLHQQELNN